MALPKIESFKGRDGQIFWTDATGDTLAEVFTPAGSYFVASYDVLDITAAFNKLETVQSLRNPYIVLFCGSHPDENNDDCWFGADFSNVHSALECFREEHFDSGVAYIELDGPDIHQLRKNPHHKPRSREREDAADRSERVMQAGMGLGVEAYNDEMGY